MENGPGILTGRFDGGGGKDPYVEEGWLNCPVIVVVDEKGGLDSAGGMVVSEPTKAEEESEGGLTIVLG